MAEAAGARTLRRRAPGPAANALIEAGVAPLLARLYSARGVQGARELSTELASLHPPLGMRGLENAATRLADAFEREEKILVIGDYDADGATSTALALLGMRALGCRNVDFLVPNRFEYGYGLTPEIVELAHERRAPRLVVTVDNGMSSIAGVDVARHRGIDVLITDHHLPGESVPAACAIVNPNQSGCAFPSKCIAGVGVMFYVLGGLRAELRARGWFAARSLAEPKLAGLLDLVALGTVADVVPLDANNRVLVQQGLRRIRTGQGRPGIRALLEVAGRDWRSVTSTDLAFVAGPRLNAAGRLDDMSAGVRCLLEDDPLAARDMASELDALNRERREIEAGMQREALAMLEGTAVDGSSLPWGLCLYRPEWHQGVVGLVASRLKERHHRPAFAFAPAGNGELKGSGRSIEGFHLRDALAAIETRQPGLMDRFGGHAMAAGLTIAESRFAAFAGAFDAEVRRTLAPESLAAVLDSDGELGAQELVLPMAEALREAGPWGQQFPEPLFDGVFTIRDQRLVGGHHLRLLLAPLEQPDLALGAIAFRVDTARWPDARIARVHIAYRLDVNEYRGVRSVQLRIEQIEAAG
jgi:single-stranded-DNA-specific exonuclease